MLTVTQAANSYDLTKLATVKAEIGDNDDDALLSVFITQASNAIAKYCNRVFAKETVAETFRPQARFGYYRSPGFSAAADGICLSRYPITQIISIVENDVTLITDTDFEIDSESGIINRLCGDRFTSWTHYGKTVVTYTTGYDLPDGLPSGIERACVLLVKQYAASGDRDPMVRSEKTDGIGQTDYFTGADSGFPPEVTGLLMQHRKPSIG